MALAKAVFTQFRLPFLLGRSEEVSEHILALLQQKVQQIILPTSLNDIASLSKQSLRPAYRGLTVCLPDGMPLVWWFTFQGKSTDRVYGPAVFLDLIKKLNPSTRQVFYGSSPQTQKLLQQLMLRESPAAHHCLYLSPPYRKLSTNEERVLQKKIEDFQPDIIWVGLSSPKQVVLADAWKSNFPHTHFVCVGAAFDLSTHQQHPTPSWLQPLGLEWLYRLVHSPRRLAKRYLWDIPYGVAWLIYDAGKRKFSQAAEE